MEVLHDDAGTYSESLTRRKSRDNNTNATANFKATVSGRDSNFNRQMDESYEKKKNLVRSSMDMTGLGMQYSNSVVLSPTTVTAKKQRSTSFLNFMSKLLVFQDERHAAGGL